MGGATTWEEGDLEEAEEEEKKALADPKFVKKSERRKARIKANKEAN